MKSMQEAVQSLPAPAVVRLSGARTAACVVEKATKSSYWVRWSESIPGTRILAGAIDLVPRTAVELIPHAPTGTGETP